MRAGRHRGKAGRIYGHVLVGAWKTKSGWCCFDAHVSEPHFGSSDCKFQLPELCHLIGLIMVLHELRMQRIADVFARLLGFCRTNPTDPSYHGSAVIITSTQLRPQRYRPRCGTRVM